MISEKMQELIVILGLLDRDFDCVGYDYNKLAERGAELLKEFLQPYKVNQVNDTAAKAE